MDQLFIFTAFIQTVLITLVLGKRASWKDLPALLLFLLMVNYTIVILIGFWNTHAAYKLTKLHFPIGFSAGPIYYYFIRFSFLPAKNVSKRWLWWFAPVVLEVFITGIYWLLVAFNSPFAESYKGFANSYNRWGFLYFALFFMAAVVFLIRHNSLITMNIVYKKQLKAIKFFIGFIVLFLIDEAVTDDTQVFFSGLIACGFTSTFLYFLLSDNQGSKVENTQNKELLKEALNEREKAVVITNEDKVVEYVNEPFLTIIGYRHRDVIGRKLSFLRGNLTTPESIEFMREKLAEKVDFEIDIINYRKNGEAYVCHIVMIPVISDEKLTHFIAYEEDVKTISAPTIAEEDLIIFEKIKTYFRENEPCKNPQLQVADIAEPLGIPTRRIGEVLKTCSDQSFSEFVNSSRIQGALKMLRSPEYQNYTIEAIGQMSGFNSKSAFHTAFKRETGKTPKAFVEEVEV
jgi:PAS domain S-box-containing protein